MEDVIKSLFRLSNDLISQMFSRSTKKVKNKNVIHFQFISALLIKLIKQLVKIYRI